LNFGGDFQSPTHTYGLSVHSGLVSIRNRETLQLSIDVVGYFFQDKEITVEENKDHEMILWLEPANLGKRIELQGIQFKVGSSEFIAGSEEKLGRLKDFLLLNSSVHIEIEGHVYELGENSFAGKRMSAARAKNVMKYLIDSGVDRTRLSAKGYGNEFMVFPEPKFDWQEQANRRVEIRILKNE
jgi:outer membrane protein OmpA-like peptidoglycan-associated protein